jgi:hypothetical protein
VLQLLVTASAIPSSPILVTLMKEDLVPPKHRFLHEPHGVTSQQTPFFIVTSVKTSNLTWAMNCLHRLNIVVTGLNPTRDIKVLLVLYFGYTLRKYRRREWLIPHPGNHTDCVQDQDT